MTALENYRFDRSLDFQMSATREVLSLPIAMLSIGWQEEAISETYLDLLLPQQIVGEVVGKNLFNLSEHVINTSKLAALTDESPIALKICLRPDLLSRLQKLTDRGDRALEKMAIALLEANQNPESQKDFFSDLFSSESWFCLSIQQTRDRETIVLKTLWHYLDLGKMYDRQASKEMLAKATTDFYRSEILANEESILGSEAEEAGFSEQDIVGEMFENLVNSLFSGTFSDGDIDDFSDSDLEELLSKSIFGSLFAPFNQKTDKATPSKQKKRNKKRSRKYPSSQGFGNRQNPNPSPLGEPNPSLLEQVIQFLKVEQWQFSQIDNLPILCLRARGNNGEWVAYIRVLEERRQLVFYSLISAKAPADKYGKILEFIARVNSGMIIGNFELDFDSGEIRYKTSIDIRDTSLNSALIANVLYNNVSITDLYFPSLMSVLYSDISPTEAIAKIEKQQIPTS